MKTTINMVKEYYNHITRENDYDGFLIKYPEFNLKEFIDYTRTLDLPFICLFNFDKPKFKFEKSLKAKDKKTLIGDYNHIYDYVWCRTFFKGYNREYQKSLWVDRCKKIELDYNKCFVDGKYTDYFDMYISSVYRNKIELFENIREWREEEFEKQRNPKLLTLSLDDLDE